jgi:hypothetical protein
MMVLDKLLGNSKDASSIKKNFLNMLILNNNGEELVRGRALGKPKKSFPEYMDHLQNPGNGNSSIDSAPRGGVSSRRTSTSPCPSLLKNLAKNGSALANNKPIEAVNRLIQHHKPNIKEATLPDEIHFKYTRCCPKHVKKLIRIEDVMRQKQQIYTPKKIEPEEQPLIKIFQQDQMEDKLSEI